MVLIIALLNDGTILTLSLDRVLPSNTRMRGTWRKSFRMLSLMGFILQALRQFFFLTLFKDITNIMLLRIALIVIIVETTWFQRTFGVSLNNAPGTPVNKNDPQLHMIAYLQVAIISQALIFVTRSHSFFFMERPSVALFLAFCVAQLVSSIIAAYGDWGFSQIQSISGGWIGIVWVWVSFFN